MDSDPIEDVTQRCRKFRFGKEPVGSSRETYLSLTAEDAIKEPESDYQEVRLLSVTDMQQALQYSADLAPAEHKSKLAANSKKRKHRNQNAELYPGKFDT